MRIEAVYLSREDNLEMLRAVASSAAPGSALVFTYTDQAVVDTPGLSPSFERMAKHAASMGEPFLSGFAPLELPALLSSVGLQMIEDLDGQALGERYSEALLAPAYSHIVHAAISGKQDRSHQSRRVDAPLVRGEAQRQATRPGTVIRCIFSLARAWWLAVGPASARTLGVQQL